MPQQYGTNGFNADGSLMNVGNQIWDPAAGGRPSIKLFPQYSSGTAMANLISGGDVAEEVCNRKELCMSKQRCSKSCPHSSAGKAALQNEPERFLGRQKVTFADHVQACSPRTLDLEASLSPASPQFGSSRRPASAGSSRPNVATFSLSKDIPAGQPDGQFGKGSIECNLRGSKQWLSNTVHRAETPSRTRKQVELLPKTAACPICQRNFGLPTLRIHVPQCRKKHEAARCRTPQRPASRCRTPAKRTKVSEATWVNQGLPDTSLQCTFSTECLASEWKRMEDPRFQKGVELELRDWNRRAHPIPGELFDGRTPESQDDESASPLERRCIAYLNNPREGMPRQKQASRPGNPVVRHGRRNVRPESAPATRDRNSNRSQRELQSIARRNGLCKLQPESPAKRALERCHLRSSTPDFYEDVVSQETSQDSPLPHKSDVSEMLAELRSSLDVQSVGQECSNIPEWNDDLVACPHCRRTFLPDRLEVHLHSCRRSSPAKLRAKCQASATSRYKHTLDQSLRASQL